MTWTEAVEAEWKRRQQINTGFRFPLMSRAIDIEEIVAAVDSLLGGHLTMGERVQAFEQRFAKVLGAPFAVMVNSGSSANLLAISALCNPARQRRLSPGDEVLVPAVCWSTSLYPVLQHGLRPVLVDVDPKTLNMDLDQARRMITARTRAIVAVHVLGNSCPMAELLDLAAKHGLLLLEDTCESLSSRSNGQFLGTFGQFGAFSFYYSHHITTGEGGMVVCTNDEDYDLLRCLRAHGWSREQSNRKDIETAHPDLDPRFLFINTGYNLRPMEIQAAVGEKQLDKLQSMSKTRIENRERLIRALRSSPSWAEQLEFNHASEGTVPVWFGFTALLKKRDDRVRYLAALSRNGVENRPIVSGNFARQPALNLWGVHADPKDFPGAEEVHQRGFFIGLHNESISEEAVHELAEILLTA